MRKLGILILAAALVVAVSSMVLATDGEFLVKINLLEHVEVVAPDDIVFDVTVGEVLYSQPAEFKVRANTAIKVAVTSSGFNEILDKYVSYSVGGFGTIGAGKYEESFDLPERSYTGDFVVNWDGVNYKENEDWTEISAAEYTDTITYTVSAL